MREAQGWPDDPREIRWSDWGLEIGLSIYREMFPDRMSRRPPRGVRRNRRRRKARSRASHY